MQDEINHAEGTTQCDGDDQMSTLFAFAFISLLISGMHLTWLGRYRG